ncbi:ANTAR domain-containing response regulator [Vagococcus elongatus]|uniref:Response regulator n=1 Tax=Vagococcus elongatus TaxID=180344 RepID=A0A430B4U6_9ENTE|nr:response regulator [Vagococcus elongatus]RSU15232.1 hypothetical protein CBF29_02550 [Vagococcus elongatus]
MIKLLIADDETLIRMDLKSAFKGSCFQVVGEAQDGFSAIKLFKQFRPEVILMDVKMPVMNGLDASRIILELDASVSIILLTAYCNEDLMIEARKIGFSGYIMKPINSSNIIPTIEMMHRNFKNYHSAQCALEKTQRRLDNRIVIDRAKGILMKQKQCSEDEAYQEIKNVSKERNFPMSEVAQLIISNDQVKVT